MWSKIPGTHYSVSDSGNIRNDDTGKIKAVHTRRDGYYAVDIYDGSGNRKTERVHRLVATAFIDNPLKKPQVNHIDGNKKNNNVSNLEWVTGSESMEHAWRIGLEPPHAPYGMRGHKNPNGGAKGKPVRCVDTGEEFRNVAACSRAMSIPDSTIFDNLYGRNHSARGYHFEFISK